MLDSAKPQMIKIISKLIMFCPIANDNDPMVHSGPMLAALQAISDYSDRYDDHMHQLVWPILREIIRRDKNLPPSNSSQLV